MKTVGILYINIPRTRNPVIVIYQIIAYTYYNVLARYLYYPITGDNSSYRNK